MLEKPDIDETKIIDCVQREFGLQVDCITFLPLGADQHTAVYSAVTHDGKPYFVKLRSGDFDETAVAVPYFLSSLGMKQVIPSLTTQAGQLWARLGEYRVILYPFVAGHNGFEVGLSDHHWVEFGRALKQLHTAVLPTAITKGIRREAFSPIWRNKVKSFLAGLDNENYDDPISAELAQFLQSRRDVTLELVRRAKYLAQIVQEQAPTFIVCHADIHAGNLLIDEHDALYMIDWDTLTFAPKERDLMFVGGALGGNGRSPAEEEALFYAGYGPTQINPALIAYYRYDRIIEDIALFCEDIFLSAAGGKDREQALIYLQSNYLSNHTIEIAFDADGTKW